MKNKRELYEAYSKFEHAEGNQHIASEFAVRKLAELVTWFKIKKVLEVGLGIGSISGTILKFTEGETLNYSGTENNSFCLKALNKNLGIDCSKLKIYPEIKEVPKDTKFDLVIIDGTDHNLNLINELVSPQGIITLEGDRMKQENDLRCLFPSNKYVHSISLQKNGHKNPFSNHEWQGGLKVIFVNPTFKQKIWWLKEKILTKTKYQYPGRHFGRKP